MVGEVRDAETAHIAIHAALTGHLVLTTLHTETAAAAVPRLIDLGVEGFLLKSTLRAVIAQRLVRQLCDRCKTPRRSPRPTLRPTRACARSASMPARRFTSRAAANAAAAPAIAAGSAFSKCSKSTEDVRELIAPSADSARIDRAAMRGGMTTMVEDGAAKCRGGATSAAEVLRVTTIR